MTDSAPAAPPSSPAARQAKSEAKDEGRRPGHPPLVKRGEPVTFQSVQREAGVSHAFLYGNADLRGRIERLRGQARPKPPPPERRPAATTRSSRR